MFVASEYPKHNLTEQTRQTDDCASHNAALAIWDAAVPTKETLAARYLADVCCIDVEQITDIDDVLRFKASCPFNGKELPCLVALVRDVVTNARKAIIRTALNAAGQKIGHRAFGPTKRGAIKLWEDAAVSTGLVIGEELEAVARAATRATHQGTLLQPAWALIDRINLRDFQVLPGIEALTILVDNDRSGDGQAAADACTRHWLAAGRYVHQLISHISDPNDIAATGAAQ